MTVKLRFKAVKCGGETVKNRVFPRKIREKVEKKLLSKWKVKQWGKPNGVNASERALLLNYRT